MKKSVFNFFGVTIFVLFLITSCSKDPASQLGVYQDDFIFYFEGKIDGQPVELSAGKNNYALETDYQSDNSDSVVAMSGVLYSSNTTEMKNAFMLQFVADKAFQDESNFNVFENIIEGNTSLTERSAYKDHPTEYNLVLSPDIVSGTYSYSWNFENGMSSTSTSPSLRVSSLEFPNFWVSLGSDVQSGPCTGKTTHWLNLDRDCDATFIVVPNHVLGGYRASIFEKEGAVHSVKWYVDNNLVSSDQELNNIPVNVDGNHTLKAEISFYSGCKKVVEKDYSVLANVPVICDLDFSYDKQDIRVYDPKQRGTVELVYFDANGKRFSSKYDNSIGNFRIHGLRNFEENDQNQKTVRFQFEGKAELKAADGTNLVIDNAFGSFAVAHP